jgi:hypothetical protein
MMQQRMMDGEIFGQILACFHLCLLMSLSSELVPRQDLQDSQQLSLAPNLHETWEG